MMKDRQERPEFDNILIKLASPEQIRAWSYGEVKKPETINYRTYKPEREGLFCEKIFGTQKEWECTCGKFKSIRYKGVVCDRCGVEVTHPKVRRERMGHIELASPVSHIWYYRSVPSRMGLLLNLSVSELKSVLYYEKYIVIDSGDTDLKKGQLLREDELSDANERFGNTNFTVGMGAEAIKTLLADIDLEDLRAKLRAKMVDKDAKIDRKLLKQIEIVENFIDSGNKPEWMILDVIPVIPPDIRPMVQLDGGRFATSDLNDLYRRVINRNNRLRRLQTLNAPDIIVRNEKRMLQEAVDALFDNSKKKKAAKGASNRPLKSLSDMLKGKQGRFRQNLLGKRVDYSGRSVIVVGPELKLHQCGLPSKMALELYKPFIIKKLVEKEVVYNIKKAKTLVEEGAEEVWKILDEVVKDHPVMLNRAPTLHRLGIQAFEPVLVEGKAIKLHPLACRAFNADFDGDQMAVHLPLTQAAQIECWTLMMSINNLLNPADGKPIVLPSLDMVLGIYQLTVVKPDAKGTGRYFTSLDEVIMALDAKSVEYQAEININIEGEYIKTTPGRLIFNESLPKVLGYQNKELKKGGIEELVAECYQKHGPSVTVELLDALKTLGFKYATKFGSTISMADIIVPEEKKEIIRKANAEVLEIQKQHADGIITQDERYNRVVEIWRKTAEEDVTKVLIKRLSEDRQGFNPVHMMVTSGARGSKLQLRQLAGMRGLMSKPNGDIIELAIRSNFKEGLSIIEFFISCNGARKGLTDTALKTSNAGYLTRRLVDISQDVVINEEDCNTINGIEKKALKIKGETKLSLANRIIGRYTLEAVKHPVTGEVIVAANEMVTEEKAKEIEAAEVESVKIRSVLTCSSQYGICRKCYGRNLANRREVEIGEAVGIIAAQSIGQPGTQLTMRTFHTGGAADKESEANEIKFSYPVLIEKISGNIVKDENGNNLITRKGYIDVKKILVSRDIQENDVLLVRDGDLVNPGKPLIKRGEEIISATNKAYVHVWGSHLLSLGRLQRVTIKTGSQILFGEDDVVEPRDVNGNENPIAKFDPFSEPIISEVSGTVKYLDLEQGETLKEEINGVTGHKEKRVLDYNGDKYEPRIAIEDASGEELAVYFLPGNSLIMVEDGENIKAGKTIDKILRQGVASSSDITGGLPKVENLFEARLQKSPAVLARVSGKVKFGNRSKGKRIIIITDERGLDIKHLVPMGKNLLVRDGDIVEAGDELCDGQKDPHEVLDILGENALQSFIIDEVQKVYCDQGVTINDKHLGIIIRQMMKKVEIVHVGDTKFIQGQHVDKFLFQQENMRVFADGGEPAVARPFFIGISRAATSVDSFLSAASFQETTKVLTNAAIAGERDYLRGLKENLLIGHLIPAGTGNKKYRSIKLYDKQNADLDVKVQEFEEQRRKELQEAGDGEQGQHSVEELE